MSLQWSNPPDQAWESLAEAYAGIIRAAIHDLARAYAVRIEEWMKNNASWTDRTGNARQTLSATMDILTRDMTIILLRYGVEYGIFLELANAGRYAIIAPALDVFAPRIWSDLVDMLG